MASVAQLLEQGIGFGIFFVGTLLATLSGLAWRRERERRMLVVTAAYLLFAVYGLVAFLEYFLVPYLGGVAVELLEHGAAVLVLAGLLVFFVALTRS
jgi:CHASE2 domain-containing sensor protein